MSWVCHFNVHYIQVICTEKAITCYTTLPVENLVNYIILERWKNYTLLSRGSPIYSFTKVYTKHLQSQSPWVPWIAQIMSCNPKAECIHTKVLYSKYNLKKLILNTLFTSRVTNPQSQRRRQFMITIVSSFHFPHLFLM